MPTQPTKHQANPSPPIRRENRPSPCKRGYDRRWEKVRRLHLIAEPLCRHCKARGVTRLATDVDHVMSIRAGGEQYDDANLQSLCHPCHSRKTARFDRVPQQPATMPQDRTE